MSSILAQIEEAERRFGKGETYLPEERDLILDRIVPEFVIRGARFATGQTRERCAKAIEALKDLHQRVIAEVPVGVEGSGRG